MIIYFLQFHAKQPMLSFSMVIENLKIIAPDRKCFRLVGGVLVERTVKDVLPALVSNRDKVNL